MTERHLRAIQPKSYTPKTSDGRADIPSDNLLLGQPHPKQSNQVWAGDITHIPTSTGGLYLAVVIDLCSRKIVDWALADHMRSELVMDALRQALGSRRIVSGCVFHSDRGRQYDSIAYWQLLGNYGMIQSMSARANPYCNAWTESFMGTLKKNVRRWQLRKRDRRTPRTLRLHRELLQHASQALSPAIPNSGPVRSRLNYPKK